MSGLDQPPVGASEPASPPLLDELLSAPASLPPLEEPPLLEPPPSVPPSDGALQDIKPVAVPMKLSGPQVAGAVHSALVAQNCTAPATGSAGQGFAWHDPVIVVRLISEAQQT